MFSQFFENMMWKKCPCNGKNNMKLPRPPSHSPLVLSCPNCGCTHPTFTSVGKDKVEGEAAAPADNRPPNLSPKSGSVWQKTSEQWVVLCSAFHFTVSSLPFATQPFCHFRVPPSVSSCTAKCPGCLRAVMMAAGRRVYLFS